jgi:hypothetical protein
MLSATIVSQVVFALLIYQYQISESQLMYTHALYASQILDIVYLDELPQPSSLHSALPHGFSTLSTYNAHRACGDEMT